MNQNYDNQLPAGQQSIWKYLRTEKKAETEIVEIDPKIAKLKTSDTVTTVEGRNRLIVIGSDVIALFPS